MAIDVRVIETSINLLKFYRKIVVIELDEESMQIYNGVKAIIR